MKKFIVFVLLLSILCSIIPSAYATYSDIDDVKNDALVRVSGLGVITGDNNGFRLDDSITRAEFTTIVCRLMNMDNVSRMETGFSDVPFVHWASGYIHAARSLGLVNGTGDNSFNPEAEITYPEVMKIMVNLLGYGSLADEKGGWPNGYITQASILGLDKYVNMSDGSVSRGEIVEIINNAFDVRPLEPDYGTKGNYVVSQYTLYEQLSNISDTVEFSGIYQENEFTSILKVVPTCEDGMIIISGTEYRTNNVYDEFFGRYVKGVARKYRNGKYEIVSMYAADNENNVKEFDTENGAIDADYGYIYKDNGKEERIKILPDAKYLYNGRLTLTPASYRGLSDAKYTLIDNTGDKIADIVMISEGKSFVVDRISEKSNSVYFKNGVLFKGRRSISLMADEFNDKSYVFLEDKDGKALSVSDVIAGSVITIFASEDLSFYTIKVSFDKIDGKVNAVGDDFIEIEGVEYKTLIPLSAGEEGIFALDVNNAVVDKLEGVLDTKYGYIIAAKRDGGLNETLKIQIISANVPQKEVKTKDGIETISYYLQNETPQIFTCCDKVKYGNDNTSGFGEGISSSLINTYELENKICAYRQNDKGEISHLNVYSIPSDMVNTKFNAEIFAFGGFSASRGFATNKNTKVICIPTYVKSIDDYGVQVKIANGGSYKVYGIKAISDFDPNGSEEEQSRYKAEEVDVLLLKSDMDSSVPLPVLTDADICIVGNVSTVVDSDGEVVRKLVLLNGDTRLVKNTQASGTAFDTASSLRMGDLIKYSTNGDGTIANIEYLASVQGQQTYKKEGNAKYGYKFYYGLCDDVLYGLYDYQLNDYTDAITISFGGETESKQIKFIPEDVKVYLYNRRLGTIDSAIADDAMSAQQSANPCKIFALVKNNDVEAIVIIKD